MIKTLVAVLMVSLHSVYPHAVVQFKVVASVTQESDTLGPTEDDDDNYMIGLPEEVLAVILARFPHPELQPWENPPDDTVRYDNNICIYTYICTYKFSCFPILFAQVYQPMLKELDINYFELDALIKH